MSEPEDNPWDHIFDDLKPFYEAIGRVVVACNRLQFELGRLFIELQEGQGRAVWNLQTSDRMQISMLLAVASEKFGPDTSDAERYPNVLPALEDLAKRAHAKLDARNEFVHSPYTLNVNFETRLLSLAPDLRSQNKYASKLQGKDLRAGMARFEEDTLNLANYVELMRHWVALPFGDLSNVKTFGELEKLKADASAKK